MRGILEVSGDPKGPCRLRAKFIPYSYMNPLGEGVVLKNTLRPQEVKLEEGYGLGFRDNGKCYGNYYLGCRVLGV